MMGKEKRGRSIGSMIERVGEKYKRRKERKDNRRRRRRIIGERYKS